MFLEKLLRLIERAKYRGIEVRVGPTVRGPEIQARLWCRSRSEEEIDKRRRILAVSAPVLASLFLPEYASQGPPVTEHLPGQSWHQWAEAADLFVMVGGRATWEGSIVKPVALLAAEEGLFHAANTDQWLPRRRQWHVQARKEDTPLYIRGFCDSWADIEMEMVKRYAF